jgi:hypothetical protein
MSSGLRWVGPGGKLFPLEDAPTPALIAMERELADEADDGMALAMLDVIRDTLKKREAQIP